MNNYYEKYLLYKRKYSQLKNIQLGGSVAELQMPVGINFEAGKIIKHVLSSSKCIAYANCQIAMDAPYHGRVADESHRSQGRSELNFPGYREDLLVENLTKIFRYIKERYPSKKLVIQIARGRAGLQTIQEVLIPVLIECDFSKTSFIFCTGYRTKDYFSDFSEEFVFVNYGMFAVLTNPDSIYVGELCNPLVTYNINSYQDSRFNLVEENNNFNDDKNILNKFESIKKIKLFGIADDMPFVTPDVYTRESVSELLQIR
jgi:hypothetical protein